MRNLIGTVATVLLLATPVMAQTPAGDSEIQSQLAWEQTVAKAQAFQQGVTNTGASQDAVSTKVGTARAVAAAPRYEHYQDN